MNEGRIAEAAKNIARNKVALAWLDEYGPRLTGRDDGARVSVHLHFAGSCTGAKEAASVLESYATLMLPDLVKQAATSCRNTIQMDTDAIREEVDKQ